GNGAVALASVVVVGVAVIAGLTGKDHAITADLRAAVLRRHLRVVATARLLLTVPGATAERHFGGIIALLGALDDAVAAVGSSASHTRRRTLPAILLSVGRALQHAGRGATIAAGGVLVVALLGARLVAVAARRRATEGSCGTDPSRLDRARRRATVA